MNFVARFFASKVGCDMTQGIATEFDIRILNWSKGS